MKEFLEQHIDRIIFFLLVIFYGTVALFTKAPWAETAVEHALTALITLAGINKLGRRDG